MTQPPTESRLFEEPPPRVRYVMGGDGSDGGEPPREPTRMSGTRAVLQLAGFLIGVGLLVWCVLLAFSPSNREKLDALTHAPAASVAALFGLSAASLVMNGAMFWVTLIPVRRLDFRDVQSVNAIAALLAYLPFKLSIVARMIIHNRRDHVPLLTIGAWMAAVAGVLVASLVPTVGAAVWRKQADGPFYLVCTLGLACMFGLTYSAAKLFSHEAGLVRLHGIADRIGLTLAARTMRSPRFRRVHVGLDMLASPVTLALAMAFRVIDLLLQAGRFTVAAHCLDTPISFDHALLAACTFYLIGVVSPSGALGAREGATTGIASLLAVPGLSHGGFAPVALTVSASEVIVNLTGAVMGAVWLRLWTMVRSHDER